MIRTNHQDWVLPIAESKIETPLLPEPVLVNRRFDVCSIEVGRTATLQVEIRNEGQGPLTVTGIESALPDTQIQNAPLTVASGASGASETARIIFTPDTEGAVSESILLQGNFSGDRMEVTVSAVAVVIPADARADFDGSGVVDFSDFLLFAEAFGIPAAAYDIDASGVVDFGDFLVVAGSFGKQVGD